MGRSKEKENVVDVMESHLITTNEDILSLTKEYAREIELPWGLILALKSKIRSYNVQLDDPWSMQEKGAKGEVEVSFSAPHIARSEEKIKSVARRHSSKEMPSRRHASDDDASEMNSVCGYPDSPISHTPNNPLALNPSSPRTPGPTPSSMGSYATPNNMEMSRLIENHQKNMKKDVDECKEFVVQSMDKIMEVLEKRLNDTNNAQAASHTA